MTRWHSEHGQDRWLAENIFGTHEDILAAKTDGVFVEFGALDGIYHSNSLYFERELGWSGLLIEANDDLWPRLLASGRRASKLHAAISDKTGITQFEAVQGSLCGWSGLHDTIEPQHRERITANNLTTRKYEVMAVTLEHALKAFQIHHVDYMSIDVEGAEYAILSVFPFARFDIDIIGVENNFETGSVEKLMTPNGYRKIARLGPDDIYRKAP